MTNRSGCVPARPERLFMCFTIRVRAGVEMVARRRSYPTRSIPGGRQAPVSTSCLGQ